jgi:hypothetical protein
VRITSSQLRQRIRKILSESQSLGDVTTLIQGSDDFDSQNGFIEVSGTNADLYSQLVDLALRTGATSFGQAGELILSALIDKVLYPRSGYTFESINDEITIGSGARQFRIGGTNFVNSDVVGYKIGDDLIRYDKRNNAIIVDIILLSSKITSQIEPESASPRLNPLETPFSFSNFKPLMLIIANNVLNTPYVQGILANPVNVVEVIKMKAGGICGALYNFHDVPVSDIPNDHTQKCRYEFYTYIPDKTDFNANLYLEIDRTNTAANISSNALTANQRMSINHEGVVGGQTNWENLGVMGRDLKRLNPSHYGSLNDDQVYQLNKGTTRDMLLKCFEEVLMAQAEHALTAAATAGGPSGPALPGQRTAFSISAEEINALQFNTLWPVLDQALQRHFQKTRRGGNVTYNLAQTSSTVGRMKGTPANSPLNNILIDATTPIGTVAAARTSAFSTAGTLASTTKAEIVVRMINLFLDDLKITIPAINNPASSSGGYLAMQMLLSNSSNSNNPTVAAKINLGKNLLRSGELKIKQNLNSVGVGKNFANADFNVPTSGRSPIRMLLARFKVFNSSGTEYPTGETTTRQGAKTAYAHVLEKMFKVSFATEVTQEIGEKIVDAIRTVHTGYNPTLQQKQRTTFDVATGAIQPTQTQIDDLVAAMNAYITGRATPIPTGGMTMTVSTAKQRLSILIATLQEESRETQDLFLDVIALKSDGNFPKSQLVRALRQSNVDIQIAKERAELVAARVRLASAISQIDNSNINLDELFDSIINISATGQVSESIKNINALLKDYKVIKEILTGRMLRRINENVSDEDVNQLFENIEGLVEESFRLEILNLLTQTQETGFYLKKANARLNQIKEVSQSDAPKELDPKFQKTVDVSAGSDIDYKDFDIANINTLSNQPPSSFDMSRIQKTPQLDQQVMTSNMQETYKNILKKLLYTTKKRR